MKIIYAQEEFPKVINKSMMLCGPIPRSSDVLSWRKEAISYLKDKFDGTIFVPESENGIFNNKYEDQIEWEEKALNICDCIVFWVPRDLNKLPGFTTNVEFGKWADSGKVVFGAPENAEKILYLKYYADKYNCPISSSLEDTLDNAIKYIGKGAERKDGEVNIPLYVWNLNWFQNWYKAQIKAGNRLDNAKILYTYRPNYKNFVFMYVLWVNIFIKDENRNKTNEFVLSRPDISSILLWKKEKTLEDSEIVLIKEFRSPSSSTDGFVRELVGGSSKSEKDLLDTAIEEVFEETGFILKKDKLIAHGARQLCSTLSAHKSNLYSVELTDEDLKYFKSQKDISHGNEEDSEKTYIETYKVKDLLSNNNFNWNCLGMIFAAWNS